MKEAVIVAYGRSAIGKAPKGTLKDTRPEEIGAQVLKRVLEKVPSIKNKIEDLIIGCAMPEGKQGANFARPVGALAGVPVESGAQTINRFCSSGLQSIASASYAIMAGQAKVIVAGGIESMSAVPMGGYRYLPNPKLMDENSNYYMTMGLTAEKVAVDYNITREEQDLFAVDSHKKAAKAQLEGKFKNQIIPIRIDNNGKTSFFDSDEGIRPETTKEGLEKLNPCFKNKGTVTAATSSQISDGAAFLVIMERELAQEMNLKPIAKFVSFAVAGVPPEVMGIGPIYAIPKALEIANLKISDIDLIELNEAFASQSLACINTLKLPKEKVNVNGGAIALGHPLGATGAILTCKLLSELKQQKGKYGLVSMCIGGGQGAAGIFELL